MSQIKLAGGVPTDSLIEEAADPAGDGMAASGSAAAAPVPVRRKLLHLELIRAVAMFLVIFNHSGTRGVTLFTVAVGKPLYPLYLFISAACKVAVPLYWMVSGALLLAKDEPVGRVLTHRVLRMVVVLAVFSAVVYVWQYVTGRVEELSLSYYLTTLWTSRFANAYWFIYAYIGMMLMLPLLRRLARAMSRRDFHYLFALVLALRGFVPLLQYVIGQGSLTLNSNVTASVFTVNVMYFMAGYYFEHVIGEDELTHRGLVRWIAAGVAALVITCFVVQYRNDITGDMTESNMQTYYNYIVGIPTFACYYAARYLCVRYEPSPKVRRAVELCGGCAFGIMLLEQILRNELLWVYDALVPYLHSLPACFVWLCAVYLVGLVITCVMKRVPGLRQLV